MGSGGGGGSEAALGEQLVRPLPLLLRGLRVRENRCHIEAATLVRGEREATALRCAGPRPSDETAEEEDAAEEVAVVHAPAGGIAPAATASATSSAGASGGGPRVELRCRCGEGGGRCCDESAGRARERSVKAPNPTVGLSARSAAGEKMVKQLRIAGWEMTPRHLQGRARRHRARAIGRARAMPNEGWMHPRGKEIGAIYT